LRRFDDPYASADRQTGDDDDIVLRVEVCWLWRTLLRLIRKLDVIIFGEQEKGKKEVNRKVTRQRRRATPKDTRR
jgi:transcriptional regulator of acetoin/glycerol metabolism